MLNVIRNLWNWWKRVAKKIGDFQARVILTLFYFVVFAPFALALRLGSDPLAIKVSAPRGWRPRSEEAGDRMERAIKQS